MHTAAREMVYVAEQGLLADGKNTLDPTWQEMLNHATAKVTENNKATVQHACLNKLLSFLLLTLMLWPDSTAEGRGVVHVSLCLFLLDGSVHFCDLAALLPVEISGSDTFTNSLLLGYSWQTAGGLEFPLSCNR